MKLGCLLVYYVGKVLVRENIYYINKCVVVIFFYLQQWKVIKYSQWCVTADTCLLDGLCAYLTVTMFIYVDNGAFFCYSLLYINYFKEFLLHLPPYSPFSIFYCSIKHYLCFVAVNRRMFSI